MGLWSYMGGRGVREPSSVCRKNDSRPGLRLIFLQPHVEITGYAAKRIGPKSNMRLSENCFGVQGAGGSSNFKT